MRLRGKAVSQQDQDSPSTPPTGTALAQLQLLAMIGMGCHYVSRGSADGVYRPICRAAIITEALDVDSGQVGVHIMYPNGAGWQQDVPYDPAGAPGSWHWPERI
jgi:hypothetical protein